MIQRLMLNGREVLLLPQKAVFIPQDEILIISDWHLGKLAHFRKEGLLVPSVPVADELNRLGELLESLPVKKVVFLGDLFHSRWNTEWDAFILYIHSFSHIRFVLTKGNHDILPDEIFNESSIQLLDQIELEGGIVLSHEPVKNLSDDKINLVGHIHPGCMITGQGRQQFRLPCFHLENNILTVPAFGKWTGLHMLKKTGNTRIFAVVNDAVLEV